MPNKRFKYEHFFSFFFLNRPDVIVGARLSPISASLTRSQERGDTSDSGVTFDTLVSLNFCLRVQSPGVTLSG